MANEKLQAYLIDELKKEGINAVAPTLEKELFRMIPKHEKGVWASPWSHRHMAFAAGLGSFGLSDGFINEKVLYKPNLSRFLICRQESIIKHNNEMNLPLLP